MGYFQVGYVSLFCSKEKIDFMTFMVKLQEVLWLHI